MSQQTIIEFVVYGKQSPQGSKIPQVIYRKSADGKPIPVVKNGRVIVVVRNDSPDLVAWRHGIAQEAHEIYGGPLLTDPIDFDVMFVRPRPASHFGTGRNAGKLKASAPEYPTTRPDNTKLRRAVEDALSGVIWKDDSQIIHGADHKRWGDRYETHVRIIVRMSQ